MYLHWFNNRLFHRWKSWFLDTTKSVMKQQLPWLSLATKFKAFVCWNAVYRQSDGNQFLVKLLSWMKKWFLFDFCFHLFTFSLVWYKVKSNLKQVDLIIVVSFHDVKTFQSIITIKLLISIYILARLIKKRKSFKYNVIQTTFVWINHEVCLLYFCYDNI